MNADCLDVGGAKSPPSSLPFSFSFSFFPTEREGKAQGGA